MKRLLAACGALALLATLNADTGIHGILVQAPLPKHISEAVVYSTVRPDKDVDGFNPVNGVQYSSAVQQGRYPNAGARAMQGVRAFHQNFTAGAGHAGATTSDMPGLETQQPGYRKRA